MTVYLDCYTRAEDLLRAAGPQLSSYDYHRIWDELERYDSSKDEIAEELSIQHGIDIEEHYPESNR